MTTTEIKNLTFAELMDAMRRWFARTDEAAEATIDAIWAEYTARKTAMGHDADSR